MENIFAAAANLVEALDGTGELAVVAGFIPAEDAASAGIAAQRALRERGLSGVILEFVGDSPLADFVGDGGVFEDPAREVQSGVGFADVAVMLSRVPQLVEIKILRHAFTGAAQLAGYMDVEGRSEGWLVIFDTRAPSGKTHIPDVISVSEGLIRAVVVDVNPVVPSRKKWRQHWAITYLPNPTLCLSEAQNLSIRPR